MPLDLDAFRAALAEERRKVEQMPPLTPEETRELMAAMKQVNDDLAPFRSAVNRDVLGSDLPSSQAG